MRKNGRNGRQSELISATEVACFAYCPEQWRLEYGLGLEPGNTKALAAGTLHHTAKAMVERRASGLIRLGQVLAIIAGMLLLWLWWWA